MNQPAYKLYPLGEGALLISFGNVINETINKQVLSVFKCLKGASYPLIDVVPAYSSLAVYYDALTLRSESETAYEIASKLIFSVLETAGDEEKVPPKQWRIPVCYAPEFGVDVEALAAAKSLSIKELITLHTTKTYRVYALGFLPGFAYMGKVNAALAAPRKAQPRTHVPAGAVGIAGEQTGIYPVPSPGGWNIIGRTPVKIFDAQKEQPVLFTPGDEVIFYSISSDEFENYQGGTA